MTSRVEKTRWKASIPIRVRDSRRFIRDGTAVRLRSMNLAWTCPPGKARAFEVNAAVASVQLFHVLELNRTGRGRIRPGQIFNVFGNPFCPCRCQSVQCAASWLVAALGKTLQGLAAGRQANRARPLMGDSE